MSDLASLFSAAAGRYGVDPAYLARTAQIESSFDPNARNASGAAGLFQFVPTTARQYGLSNPLDAAAATDAAARLARDNQASLSKALGRAPSSGELYLAHQQGAGGAAKLLSNPHAPAASIVGERAITANGAPANISAGGFADLWVRKFAGGKPVALPTGDVAPATPGAPAAPQFSDALLAAAGLNPALGAGAYAGGPAAAPAQAGLSDALEAATAAQARRAALFNVKAVAGRQPDVVLA